MGFKRALPGKELFLRELVAAAGFLNGDDTGEHCRHDRCFAAHHPSLGVRWRKFIFEIHCASLVSGRLVAWASISAFWMVAFAIDQLPSYAAGDRKSVV